MKPALVLIGPGRVGCALGHRLHQAGYPIAAVIGREQKKVTEACHFIGCASQLASTDLQDAESGTILLLTLPDDQLEKFSAGLLREVKLPEHSTLVHCSGLHPAAILRHAHQELGTLSIHPLLPFSDREMAVANLQNCPCAIEGDQDRLDLGQQLVSAWGGQPFLLPSTAKQSYHAAASIASNFMVTLTACARDLLASCGFDQQQAMQLLAPLQRATSANLLEYGPEQALTGPIVRGDVGTVALHLKALQTQSDELAGLYRTLAAATLQLAQKSGRLPKRQARKISLLLEK